MIMKHMCWLHSYCIFELYKLYKTNKKKKYTKNTMIFFFRQDCALEMNIF